MIAMVSLLKKSSFNAFDSSSDGIMPCQRKVSFNIPDSYISSGSKPSQIFDIGTVNMQIIFEKEERDCLN